MDHSFPETNKMMNAPNGETNCHFNFMPQQFSEQQFQQRTHSSEWTNHQVMMNAFSLPKTSLDHFSGDPLMWHQWYSFFKSTIHDNPALSTDQKMTHLQNSVTHRAKDFICGYSYNRDFYEEALQELIRKFGKPQHVVSAYLAQLEQWPRTRVDDPSSFVSYASFLRRLVQTFRLQLHLFESDLKASAVVKVAKKKLTTPMTIHWNQHVRSMRIEQPNLADFADWIRTYAEVCEDVSPQRPQKTDRLEQPSQSQKHSNIVLQASSSCQLCSGDHNLGRCKEYRSKSVADRQQLVRHHNLCVNCLKRHESGFCKSKIRCLVDRCNGFHHSTLHRNGFRTLQRSDLQATSKGVFQSRNNPVQSNYSRNFNHTTSQLSSAISKTPNNINRRRYNQNSFNPRNPSSGNNNSHQTAIQHHINPQQTNDRSNTQFQSVTSNELNDDSSNLPRVQNHTCSRNREPTWVRAFIQLQAIPVTLFYKDFNIETYALLDSASDNTQITQNIADALRIRVPKEIELTLASLHGEHTTTVDVMIGSIHSSQPVTSLPVYATSFEQFQMLIVPAEMLNRLCRDHDHLAEINFPQIRDKKIGILIEADAFLATVPRHFTTGKPGTPYGVNTLLGWTLTGPVSQEYFQPNHKGSSNHNITLFNHLKRGSDDPDEIFLRFFWTFEGVIFSQGSTKGHNEEDQKAMKDFGRDQTSQRGKI